MEDYLQMVRKAQKRERDGKGRNVLSVVEEIVSQVVANVSKDTTAEDRDGGVPVIKEDSVCQVPEGCGNGNEQCRGHHEPQSVHGEVVVNAVQEEMCRDRHSVVWEVIVEMEKAAMQTILHERPDAESCDPVQHQTHWIPQP